MMDRAAPTSSLFAAVTQPPGAVRVKLVGPSIGQREAPIITDIVVPVLTEAARSPGWRWLVLDLSAVTFMNSMGLGMCIDFRNRAHKSGAKSAIVGMSPDLASLFRMVRVDRLFSMAKDEEELAKIVK
jgi:anti-anti-sigma factor